ncbi:MAG TPA: type II secretion system major pseudopilin GspG [Phycisphaerales bacterium]|nr:type II secretion system major pseudopilin GspG [Phycisphaerales bacterium]
MSKSTRNTRRAFTIMEVIVVVVIIGVLAAVIAPRFFSRIADSRVAVAQSNATAIATAMKGYILDCGMPEAGADLSILIDRPANVEEGKWKGPYLENVDQLKDPWGNDFQLRIPAEFNADFDIVSYGSDGAPGGEGEAADIVNGKR